MNPITSPIIEVKEITRTFRSLKKEKGWKGIFRSLFKPHYTSYAALKGVSFQLEKGSFNGLIGENGAGKTTLLKMLAGLIPPTSGKATVLGEIPFHRSFSFRSQIALIMGQKAQLWWDLPAIDAFDLIRAIYEIPKPIYQKRLCILSQLLEVQPHLQTQLRRLSLGERMKMEFIGALLHWPQVIFLDEPTIGLDVLAAHRLREFLKDFNQKEKSTIILTSHNMDDIERLCSKVLILKAGQLVYDGEASHLMKKEQKKLKIHFTHSLSLEELVKITHLFPHQIAFQEKETRIVNFHLHQKQIPSVLQSLIQKAEIIHINIEEESLESIIQRFYLESKSTS